MEKQLTLPLSQNQNLIQTGRLERLALIKQRHAEMNAACATLSKTTTEDLETYREVRDLLLNHEVEVLYAERNDRKNELRAVLIESKFVLDPATGCRVWTGATSHGKDSPESFGVVYWTRKSIPAHTIAFTIRGNEIPEGFVVTQTCGNLLCGEQSHLYAKPKYNQRVTK